MNKKFSTLVAALLLAGAWTTLDAKVTPVSIPEVGGTYVLGLSASGNDVTGLVTGIASIVGNGGTEVAAFGNEWTFEVADAKKKTFYLQQKSSGEYIAAKNAAGNVLVLTKDKEADNVIVFKINGSNKIEVVSIVNAGSSSIVAGNILQLSGTGGAETLQAAATGSEDIIFFGTFSLDKITLSGNYGNQVINAVAEYKTDEYYFIAQEGGKALVAQDAKTMATAEDLTNLGAGKDIDLYLWKVEKGQLENGSYKYKFVNKKFPELYAYIGNTASDTEFSSETPYNKGFNLTHAGVDVGANLAADAGNPVAVGLYNAITLPIDADVLNKRTTTGFDLTFKVAKDSDKEIVGAEAFAGGLVAVDGNGDKITATGTTKFQIKSGDNYIVLVVNDKKDENKNLFEVVTKEELDKNTDGKYYSWFEFAASTSTKSTDVVTTIKVGSDDDLTDARTIILEDNLSDKVAYLRTRLTPEVSATYPYITLTASDMVDYKELLGKFMSISFLTDKAEEQDNPNAVIYKKNGILSTVDYDADGTAAADYVNKNSVLSNAPEVQWAITAVNANKTFTLTNRESGETLTNVSFRQTGKDNVYKFETVAAPTAMVNDTVEVKLFGNDDITKFDGFRTATPNELRNQKFRIGQYHNETQNAVGYWAENHQTNGTHQLGVVADEDAAGIWNLRLDQKVNKDGVEINEVDTVFITTTFYTEDEKGNQITDPKKQTKSVLAVLPYEIQNRENLEYVKFLSGNNLNYYVCNEIADERTDFRFALKAKPNGYSIVTLPGRSKAAGEPSKAVTKLGDKKIDVANSVQWGALKQRGLYEVSDNSIMVVKEDGAPEYRKVVKEWGDTVRIYRQEYPTEVLFEKRDDKSIVEKDTLSFLNVNNSITGANPALFVDTAYVNRVDADGVKNTCYQYLLAVGVNNGDEYHCPLTPEHNTQEWKDQYNNGKPCPDALTHKAVKGRFLINLVDTAFAYKQEHLHNNPYVNNIEAYEHLAKLSFVEGIHADDTLYITRKGGEVVKLAMDTAAFNVAKFAFHYVDNEKGSFKIQTRWKDYAGSTTLEELEESANDNGYLRWVNGTIVVTNSYLKGETFNMEEGFAGNPTANENAPEVAGISVVATNGAVIVKGAEGKNVVITNVLGQTIANTTISSSEATIAAPAGVVVVAVEGEAAVKAIVK